ncbi:MAG: hypothetical protein ACRD1E_09225, partial [Terriglobales bacterium]
MATLRTDEISEILRAQIENYDTVMAVDEVGTVVSVGDGIARVYGLEKVMAGELLAFPHGVAGIAMNLEEDQVGTVMLGDYAEIREGDQVKRTHRIMSIPVGDTGAIVTETGRAEVYDTVAALPGLTAHRARMSGELFAGQDALA